MRYLSFKSLFLLLFIFSLLFSVDVYSFAQDKIVSVLHDEDRVAVTKPAVIRIVHHVSGVAHIPEFTIDVRNKTIQIDTSRPGKNIPVEETLFGSGFIVSEDGYIVTNSHVVSLQTVKVDAMTDSVLQEMYEGSLSLSDEESRSVFASDADAYEFSKKIFDMVSARSNFELHQEVIVLNPSSNKESLDDLKQDGFLASVISVNDNFYNDDKDVAIIKIDQENLPTLPLGNAENIKVGTPISIFGFPATAEFNSRNPLESTFTQGVISALKNSEKKIFKVFQTDAKVSEGSSGGPLVAADGSVIGIVTFESNQLQKNSGDNFAFSIPIEIVKNMIQEQNITLLPSPYRNQFFQGLDKLQDKHCVEALQEFQSIQSVNTSFQVQSFIEPYIQQCESLIENHQSIDTRTSSVRNMISGISPFAWVIMAITSLFACSISFILWWLIREVKREELTIDTLEKKLAEEQREIDAQREVISKMK